MSDDLQVLLDQLTRAQGYAKSSRRNLDEAVEAYASALAHSTDAAISYYAAVAEGRQ